MAEDETKRPEDVIRIPHTYDGDQAFLPPRFDRVKRQQKLLAALRAGATRSAAYAVIGVKADTFHQWMQSDPEFMAQVKEAEAFPELACSATILKAAQGGDWRAALAWLERRRPDDWRRTDEVNFRDLTTEQLLGLFRSLESEDESDGPRRIQPAEDRSEPVSAGSLYSGPDRLPEPSDQVLPADPWGRAVE